MHAGVVLEAVNGADVRVVERSEHLRLALEPRETIGVARECLGQNLQRDVAIELRVACTPHLAHAARTEQCDDFIRTENTTGGDSHRGNCRRIVSAGPSLSLSERVEVDRRARHATCGGRSQIGGSLDAALTALAEEGHDHTPRHHVGRAAGIVRAGLRAGHASRERAAVGSSTRRRHGSHHRGARRGRGRERQGALRRHGAGVRRRQRAARGGQAAGRARRERQRRGQLLPGARHRDGAHQRPH